MVQLAGSSSRFDPGVAGSCSEPTDRNTFLRLQPSRTPVLGAMKVIAAFVLLLAVSVSAGDSPCPTAVRQTSMLPMSALEGSDGALLRHR